jgi:uncharacterized protein YfbU (UPF0304 family)
MIFNTYDAILNGYEAESDQDAIDYAREMVWYECETLEQSIGYYRYINTVGGVDIYYDYGADYYFFCPSED